MCNHVLASQLAMLSKYLRGQVIFVLMSYKQANLRFALYMHGLIFKLKNEIPAGSTG